MVASPANDVDPTRDVRRVLTMREDWLCGLRGDVSAFTDALAEEFHYATPDGRVREYDDAVEYIEDSGGDYADSSPPFTTDIHAIDHRVSVYDVHLVTYDEEWRVDGDREKRIGSALLREDSETTTGLEWLHLHESRLIARSNDSPEDDE